MPRTARDLARTMGLRDATALVVGGIVGTSIFLVPGAAAAAAGGPIVAIAAWVTAGLMAGIAALSFAELSAALPKSGGSYVFIGRAYRSELLAFSFAWMMSIAYGAGAIAVVAILAATYGGPILAQAGFLVGSTPNILAAILIAVMALLNALGVKRSGLVLTGLTILKVSLLTIVLALPVVLLHPAAVEVTWAVPSDLSVVGFGAALMLCFFAYNGAFFITHVAEEVRDPERNIPRAIMIGFATVLLFYLALNTAYLTYLPFEVLATTDRVAAVIVERAIGPTAGLALSAAIFVSALGVLNAQLLNYPRILFALARDGLMVPALARVNPRTAAPANAILTLGGWAIVLTFAGGYREILATVAFVVHAFVTLAVAGLILLRIREPDLARPYRIVGYPLTPAIFIGASVIYLISLAASQPLRSAMGVALVVAGLPIYAFFRRRRVKSD